MGLRTGFLLCLRFLRPRSVFILCVETGVMRVIPHKTRENCLGKAQATGREKLETSPMIDAITNNAGM